MDAMPISLLALFATVALYVLIVFTRRTVERFPSHSLTVRAVASFVSWCFIASLFTYLFSVLSLLWIFFTDDPMTGFSIVVHAIIWMIGARMYAFYDERWETTETAGFIADALLFRNYMRRKDHEIQHEIDRWNTERIHREVTGREISSEIFRTVEDAVTKEKRTSQRLRIRSAIRHRHDELLKQLSDGRTADAGEEFRFELLTNNDNPLLPLMKEFVIDPSGKELSISLRLQENASVDFSSGPVRNRFAGEMYVALTILFSLDWIQPYHRFLHTVTVTVFRSSLDDDARFLYRDVATFRWNVQAMRERGEKITGIADIEKLGEMRFY